MKSRIENIMKPCRCRRCADCTIALLRRQNRNLRRTLRAIAKVAGAEPSYSPMSGFGDIASDCLKKNQRGKSG